MLKAYKESEAIGKLISDPNFNWKAVCDKIDFL